jgi:hypothetical protein
MVMSILTFGLNGRRAFQRTHDRMQEVILARASIDKLFEAYDILIGDSSNSSFGYSRALTSLINTNEFVDMTDKASGICGIGSGQVGLFLVQAVNGQESDALLVLKSRK